MSHSCSFAVFRAYFTIPFFCTKVRAIDKYLSVWIIVTLNATIATLLREVGGFDLSKDVLTHWDTVRIALKTNKGFSGIALMCCPCPILRITAKTKNTGHPSQNSSHLIFSLLLSFQTIAKQNFDIPDSASQ